MRTAVLFLVGALLGAVVGGFAVRAIGGHDRSASGGGDLLAELPSPGSPLASAGAPAKGPLPKHAARVLGAVETARPGDAQARTRGLTLLAGLSALGGDEATFLRLATEALSRGLPLARLLDAVREFPVERRGALLVALLDAAPGPTEGAAEVARMLAESGQGARALALVREALPRAGDLDPALARWLVRLDPDGAAAYLLSLEGSETWDASRLATLRGLLAEAGQEAALLPFVQRALEERPGDHGTLRLLRRLDPTAAAAQVDAMLRKNPSDPWAWSFLGELRKEQGDTAAAFDAYRRAAERDPSRSTFRELLRLDPARGLELVLTATKDSVDDEMIGAQAEAYAQAGRTAEAVAALLRAHQHDPEDGEWIARLTELDPAAAVEVVGRRVLAAPEAASARWIGRYARALEAAGKGEDAFAQFLEAHRRDPDDDEWQRSIARLDPARAVPVLEAHAKARPGDASGRGALGLALAASGRRPEAIEQLDAALAGGDVKRWYPALAELAPDRAVDGLRRRAEAEGDRASLYGMLGTALRERGDLAGARAAFDRAAELDPSDRAWAKALSELR